MAEREQNGHSTAGEEFDKFLKQDRAGEEKSSRQNSQGFLTRLKKDKEFRDRIIHTAIVCWSFITLGWAAGMGGPTFPDLRQIVQKDLATSSWIFTVGAIGYITGSILFGALYDKFNRFTLLIISSFIGAVFQCIQPWCPMFPVMLIVRFIASLFSGGMETGGNADIPFIWGTESGPYMQALHLCFCLGAILSPLVAEPFLAKKICVPISNSSTESTMQQEFTETPLSLNRSQDIVPSCHEVYGDTSVHYAFMISAVLIFTATLGYIFLYCKMSHVHAKLAKLQKAAKDSKSTSGEDQEPDYMPTRLKGVLLVLLASLMMSYCVMEDGFASFLMTFSLSYLKWDKETGAVITTVFWALFVLGRFSGIFLVSRFKQKTLLTTYLILITLSILGFLLAAVYMVIPLLWVFTGMLGFSMSVVFPCIFGWTSENIMQITGKISAMFLVSAGLGAMLYPLLVGYLMEFHSPMWFVFMLMITMVLTLTIYGTIRLLARICIYRKSHDKHLGKEMTVLKPRKDESR